MLLYEQIFSHHSSLNPILARRLGLSLEAYRKNPSHIEKNKKNVYLPLTVAIYITTCMYTEVLVKQYLNYENEQGGHCLFVDKFPYGLCNCRRSYKADHMVKTCVCY
jgi:hypothetical protein